MSDRKRISIVPDEPLAGDAEADISIDAAADLRTGAAQRQSAAAVMRRNVAAAALANALLVAAERRPASLDCVIAFSVVAAGVVVEWLINRLPHVQTALQFSLMTIIVVAWLCSLRASLLAVFAAAIAEVYLFVAPRNSFWIAEPGDAVQYAVFVLVSLAICLLADRVKRTRQDRAIALRRLLASDRARAASEHRLDAGLNAVVDPILLLTPVWDQATEEIVDFTIDYANAAAARFGERANRDGTTTPPLPIGQRLSVAAPSHQRLGLISAYAGVVKTGRALDRAVVVGSADGDDEHDAREIEVRVAPLGDGVVVHWRDVSEHRRAQITTRNSEERYRSLVQAIGAIVWRTNAAGEFDGPQVEWSVFTGQRPDEILGMGWLNAVHPDDRVETMAIWQNCVLRRRDCSIEHRLRRSDGEYRHMLARGVPIRDAAGEVREWVGVHTDITDRRRAAQIIADSERQLRRVLNALYAFVGVLTLDGTLVGVNEAPLRATGLRAEEVIGKKIWDCPWWGFDETLRRDLQEWVLRARRGEVVRSDVPTRVAGGRTITIDFMLAPMRDENGDITHLIPSGVDVSDRVHAQTQLADRERHYRQLTEGLPMLTWTCTPNGACDYMSQRWIQYSGLGADQLVGDRWLQVVHPDDRAAVVEAWNEAVRDGTRYACEFRIRRKDGEYRWFDTRAEPIRDAAGNVQRWFGTNVDIHDRRRAEQRFRRLYESNLAGVVFYDIGGSLSDPNDAFLALLGYDPSEPPEAGTLNWNQLVVDDGSDNAANARARWKQLAQTGRCEPFEVTLRRTDGKPVPVMVAAAELEPGHHAFGVAYVVDLTHVKAVEEALRRTEANLRMVNESLEHRIQERTLELQHRSDQLRALALDLTETESRERKRLAQVLHDHFQQLVSAAKLKVGIIRRRLNDPSLIDTVKQVESLLEETINASRSLATELSPPVLHDAGLGPALEWLARRMEKEHNLSVTLRFDPNCEPDNEQVRTIVFECARELLFNVVKHAGANTAELNVSAPQEGLLQLAVVDQGKGFDAQAMELKAKPDGSFGLFSIKERLGLLGGLLKVRSQPDRGTTVSMTVPVTFKRVGQVADEASLQPELTGSPGETVAGVVPHVRVLVADDHKLFREGLISLIQQEPFVEIVGQANDGEEALALARQLNPDILIVDVTMPKLNGVQVTTQLAKERPDVKIIGLSMHERDDMAKAMRDAGAIAYCTKGGPTESLLNVLRSAAAR